MLSEKDVIAAYEAILLRTPTENEIQGWIAKGLEIRELQQIFLNSEEFKLRINRENSEKNQKSTDFSLRNIEKMFIECKLSSASDGDAYSTSVIRFVELFAKIAGPRTILAFGGHPQLKLAVGAANASPMSKVVVITNICLGGNEPFKYEGVRVVFLPLTTEGVRDLLFRFEIFPDMCFCNNVVDFSLIDIYVYLHNAAALFFSNVNSDLIQKLENISAKLMGEVIKYEDLYVAFKSEQAIPPKYKPGGALSVARGAEKIGLGAIVKNEEQLISEMMTSCGGLIDYAVIVDTGSSDKTVERAKETLSAMRLLGEVIHIDFIDFSQARNTVIQAMPEDIDWILMLDADEYIVDEDKSKFVDLARESDVDAWSLPRYNFIGPSMHGLIKYPDRQTRFFRNKRQGKPYFVNKVHERLEGISIRKSAPANLLALSLDVGGPHIHHLGILKPKERKTLRHEQNSRLTQAET